MTPELLEAVALQSCRHRSSQGDGEGPLPLAPDSRVSISGASWRRPDQYCRVFRVYKTAAPSTNILFGVGAESLLAQTNVRTGAQNEIARHVLMRVLESTG